MEFGRIIQRNILIQPSANNGFIVDIGCCTCIFETRNKLLDALEQYLSDAEGHEKRYNQIAADSVQAEQPSIAPPNEVCDTDGIDPTS